MRAMVYDSSSEYEDEYVKEIPMKKITKEALHSCRLCRNFLHTHNPMIRTYNISVLCIQPP